jgi:hypothetical protein
MVGVGGHRTFDLEPYAKQVWQIIIARLALMQNFQFCLFDFRK